jgi:hypothetical protein
VPSSENGLPFVDGVLSGNVILPHELLPGKSCSIWLGAKEVANALRQRNVSGKVKLVGYYKDATGRIYRSRPAVFDTNEWPKERDNRAVA